MSTYVGIDIGGSFIKTVLVKNSRIISAEKFKTPKSFNNLIGLIGKISPKNINGAGVSIAGVLDEKREKVLKSPNIKYLNNKPVKKLLGKKLKKPVKIEHDVNCFLLAEKKIGSAKKIKNAFYLTLGTGVGGALMFDGKIYKGSHGSAGEIGHSIIKCKMQNAKCKTIETLEELASSKFIKKSLGVDFLKALKRAKLGDKKAKKVFALLGENLGIGIANIINIFNPETVILSGGIADAKQLILPGIKKGIKRFVISPRAKNTKIIFSRLGNTAGALGATLLF